MALSMKLANSTIVLIAIVILYVLISIEFQIEFKGVKLFANDLSDKDVVAALFYEIALSIYLTIFGVIYFVNIPEEFKSRLFISLIMESLVFALTYIIFGHDEPLFIKIISNSIPLSYIIYSYIAYGRIQSHI